jgi:hypothetical protein
MQTKNIKINSRSLSDTITEHIQELAEATDLARLNEEMISYLDMYAKFHKYSPHNVWLIMMSNPEASMVAGYCMWQSMGRFGKKGEKGIPILAPLIKTIDNDNGEDEQKLVGFKVVYVFDVSQTDGEPLPDPPNWKSPEKNTLLQEKLIKFAEDKGIKVSVKKLAGDTQGLSRGGEIELAPEAGTKTLIHEIAHELMHRGDNRPLEPRIRELEAESVAYVVGRHFGLNDLSSPNYNALHGATSELIQEHIEQIRIIASKIISSIVEV